MIFFFSITIFLLLILVISISIFFNKILYIVPPIGFAALFVFITFSPNFVGYAVQEIFVDHKEAVVLYVNQGEEWIYFLVVLRGDTEPRLVQVPNTPENKKAADDIKKQTEQGLTVIQFGVNPTESAGQGNNHNTGNPVIKLLQYSQTTMFNKPQN